MKAHPGVAAGLFCLAALAWLASAAPASAAVRCHYSPPNRLLEVTATDAFTRVVRVGDAIEIDDGQQLAKCTGPTPTVLDSDRVQITHTGSSADVIDLRGGPFSPGASLEPQGSPEIEIEYVGPTFLNVRGTQAADRLSFGAGGINLNGDDDTDVTGQFSVLLVEGRGSDDLLSPQPDYTTAAGRRVMLGGAGRDRLIATPDGAFLHGGNGRDRLIGGARADNLTGGRGNDLIRGGKGRDLIRAIDNRKDRVSCGPGFDRAKVDGVDRIKGCERLIAVKRRGPVKRAERGVPLSEDARLRWR
jgi:Ca2+-binding RTX toxin-like protein